ncbi:MAG TPA: hypothetical protein VF103_01895 [Polyangiaceae bacterium]
MRRPASTLVLVLAALVALAHGCSGRSIVIGGDPLGAGGTDAASVVTGGGGVVSGGAFPTGGVGVGGTIPVGGTQATGGFVVGGAGGALATGGTTIPVGGTSSAVCGYNEGGEGNAEGIFDPYPCVAYEDGEGYRRSCPRYEDTWGFTCFANGGLSCSPNGNPYCAACSCAVPCETGADCPLGITGQPADCIGSETLAKSCFLLCIDGESGVECPRGMTCTRYPGVDRDVCVWVSYEPFGQPPI